MAKKEISIVLRAKNAMAAGIASAGHALKSFGSSALRIGKFFTTIFASAAGAVAAFTAKAISAYAVQERAVASLSSALDAYGEISAGLIPKLKEQAAAIQDETGVADESTIAGMARLKMLGVQTEKLGAAAKATIALKSIGLEEAAAQKAVAMAMQGNYEMLNRYVPALRSATSETEKAEIVNGLFTRGYEQQKALLNTTSGAWAALKGRIGDAWEEAGKAIETSSGLTSILTTLGDKVKSVTQRFADWASNGGLVDVKEGVKTFAEEAGYRFKSIGLSAKLAWAVLADGAETAFNYMWNLAKATVDSTIAQFRLMGDWATAIWDKIRHPSSDFVAPDMTAYNDSMRAYVDAVKGKDALVAERTKKALTELASLNVAHLNRLNELEAEHLAAKEAFAKKKAEAEKKAAEAERLAAEQAEKAKVDAARKAAEEARRIAEEKAAKEKGIADDLAEYEAEARQNSTEDVLGTIQSKRRNLTLQERSSRRLAGLDVGQLADRSSQRMLALWGRAKTAQDRAAERQQRAAAAAMTKNEREKAVAERSAADRNIGMNVQKIADKIEESLKPA